MSISFSNEVSGQRKAAFLVGLNLSSFETANLDSISSKSRIGWQFGGDLLLGRGILNFQPGLYYTKVGNEVTTLSPIGFTEQFFRHTIKVPLNLCLNLVRTDLIGIRLYGGLTGTYSLKVDKNDLGVEIDDFYRIMLGGNGGLGVDVLFFTADLRYEFGLSEVFNKSAQKEYFQFGDGLKNNIISLSVGLNF